MKRGIRCFAPKDSVGREQQCSTQHGRDGCMVVWLHRQMVARPRGPF